MKKILALLMAALMLFALTACGGADDKLVVGITEYAPMDYKDDNGEWTGFDAEFARLFGEKIGKEVEFVEIDWDNKFVELKADSIDCIWNGMTITDEVLDNTDCSNPYVKNAQVVVMKKDLLENYPDAASMKDLTFAVEAGSAGEKEAVANEFKTVAVTAQSDALLEVSSGSSDACIIDITMANAMTGEGTGYEDLGFAVELSVEEYGVGFRKGDELVNTFNEFMAEIKADGTLQALADKYELTLAD